MINADSLRISLPAILEPVLGDPVTIEDVQTVSGGARRGIWSLLARTPGARRRLILRSGHPDELHAGMELEARAQWAAGAAGAVVPHVLIADGSPDALSEPYLICDQIAGETIARKILRGLDDEARAGLLRQCAQALAAIHRADTTGIGAPHRDQLVTWRAQLDDLGTTTATFEWALRWLVANRPEPAPARLVHGDFRMGNLIVDGGRLAAVLDWELVHIGDFHDDLAWFCIRAWRYGAPSRFGAGGLGGIQAFLQGYEDAAGVRVDRDTMRWWLVMSTLRWGIICCQQAQRHLSGQSRSIELAAIGRRVCETEWDLLELLDDRRIA